MNVKNFFTCMALTTSISTIFLASGFKHTKKKSLPPTQSEIIDFKKEEYLQTEVDRARKEAHAHLKAKAEALDLQKAAKILVSMSKDSCKHLLY